MSHPPARPSIWQLCWSFTWRQAAAMVAATIVLGIGLSISSWLGASKDLLYKSVPYFTFAIMVFSIWEASRHLLNTYDIRLHGAHHDEQNHRHRR